jgi:NAD(P)-dependent dehydrogenase (short-subunit alcohol dehydrogenase family)
LSLTRFLAREWAHQGVRVNSITPGFFPSDITRPYLFEADGSSSPRGLTILNHTPMRRYGSPDELAGAAVYLASKRASGFVTGADMKVDGGFLAMTI